MTKNNEGAKVIPIKREEPPKPKNLAEAVALAKQKSREIAAEGGIDVDAD